MSTLVSDTPQRHYQENGNNENGVNFVLTPDIRPEIKNEPPEDIDDRQQLHSIEGVSPENRRKPNIRLTPTMKLLASPNPVDPKRKFSCPYDNCTKSYGKSSHLRSHLTWHTGIKPYVCQEPKCGKSFTRSDELNRHSRTHTGEKPFECMQCGKKFSRSDHLTKHVATHTKQLQSQKRTRVSINIDRRPMPNERSSVAAEQRPAVAEGGESRVDFSNGKSKLTDQQSSITSQDDAPAAKKRNTKSNELIPGQDIAYTDGMQFMASLLECAQFKHGRHVIETENLNDEQLEEARLPIRIKLEKPEHSDEYKIVNAAAYKQEDSTLLNQKVKVKTEEESTERLQSDPHADAYAEECNGIINAAEESDNEENANDDSILLEANATIPFSKPARAPTVAPPPRIENVERPYGCYQCPKSFKRQDDLNRHLRTHTGEKPYACTACEKRFMRSDHLKKHLKTHFKHL